MLLDAWRSAMAPTAWIRRETPAEGEETLALSHCAGVKRGRLKEREYETVSHIISGLAQKFEDNEESNANRNMERLEMAHIRLEAALATSDKWKITDASLLRWRRKLKRAAQECNDTLHKCKQRIIEDEQIEWEVKDSSFPNRIVHATKSFVFSVLNHNNNELSRSVAQRFERAEDQDRKSGAGPTLSQSVDSVRPRRILANPAGSVGAAADFGFRELEQPVMEAARASRLKLGVGMDTVAALTPPRRPSSSASKPLGTSSRTAVASPRPLVKAKQRRSISCSINSPPAAARPARSPCSCASASASSAAAAAAEPPQKEKDLVFVAGATGRVGSRAVRELVKLGFRVRAAVRNAQRASSSSLVQSVQQLKLDGDAAAIPPAEKLEIVECDLEKQPQDGIVKAIGNASLVVCSIGASEKEILDVTGPYRIDYMATRNLVEAVLFAKLYRFVRGKFTYQSVAYMYIHRRD
nr:unnamed protein product [Digitaria exilis]